MSHVLAVLETWAGYYQKPTLGNGPAGCLSADMSPAEMARLMLATHEGQDRTMIVGYLHDVINGQNYKVSPEFRGKLQSAIRILQGGTS